MGVDPPAGSSRPRAARPEDEQDRVTEARAQGWLSLSGHDARRGETRRTPVGPRFRRRPSWGAGASRVERLRRRAGAGRAAALRRRAPSSDLEQRFIARCAELPSPSVLELGTLQSVPGRSTLHRDWVPHAAEFLGTDIEAGPDVDIVADLHRLSRVVGVERFDVILSALDVRAPQVPDAGRARADEGAQGRWPALHPDPPVVPAARLPERLLPLLPGRAREPVRHDAWASRSWRPTTTSRPGSTRGAGPATQRMPAFLNTTLWGEKRAPTPDEYRYELPPVPGA